MANLEKINLFFKSLENVLTNAEKDILKEITNSIKFIPKMGRFPEIENLQIFNLSIFSKKIDLKLKKGINLISGDTGAGKSTILNSAEFALFGQSSTYKYGDFSRKTVKGNRFETQLIFLMDSDTYRLTRSIPWNQNRQIPKLEREVINTNTLDGRASKKFHLVTKDSVSELDKNLNEIFQGDCELLHDFFEILFLKDRLDRYLINPRIKGKTPEDFIKYILYSFEDFNLIPKIIKKIEENIKEAQSSIKEDQKFLELILSKEKRIENMNIQKIIKGIENAKANLSKKEDDKTKLKNRLDEDFYAIKDHEEPDTFIDLRSEKRELQRLITIGKDIKKDFSNFQERIENLSEIECNFCHRKYIDIAKNRIKENNCPECGQEIIEPEILENWEIFKKSSLKKIDNINLSLSEFEEEKSKLVSKYEKDKERLEEIESQCEEISRQIDDLKNDKRIKESGIDIDEKIFLQDKINHQKQIVDPLNTLKSKIEFCYSEKTRKFYSEIKKKIIAYQGSIFRERMGKINYKFEFISSRNLIQDFSTGEYRLLDIL
ncbi:MAG: AAA family ATPase, partial [Candidatus Lokiarchaeota archaeon]|nr:AAA family ATPase [Candidatus Lokiarchaeota archaeon]